MSSISQSSIDTGIDKEHNITEHLNYSFDNKSILTLKIEDLR